MDYLEFIARVTSHIPDKRQVTVRYYGVYANAHRGKVRKASLAPSPLRIIEEELRGLPAKGWAALIRKPHIGLRIAAMIRKVYEVDPMLCPDSEAKKLHFWLDQFWGEAPEPRTFTSQVVH